MSTMTNLEKMYMDQIAYCEMNSGNGARPGSAADVNTYAWADERAAEMGINENQLGGVIASLIKKGFIGYIEPCADDPDGGVWFTDAGYAAWEAAQ